VADNGIMTREAKVKMDAQGAVLKQAQAARESLSGVNLDEEAAEMLKFQRAYQASSKILEIGNQLFDTILSLGR
jgi:flagellar hook-associated protein 1 FlgK